MADSAREEWSEWRLSVFGDPYLVWHEGPDFTELLRIVDVGGEPALQQVRTMLKLGLNQRDPLAAQSIDALATHGFTVPDAEPLLRNALAAAAEEKPGTFLTAIARTLRTLTGDEAWSSPIIRVLTEAPDWSSRIDAAFALRAVDPTSDVLDALTKAMADPEYLVRYNAAQSLLAHAYSTPPDISRRRALFAKLSSATDRAPTDWREAAQSLAAECVPLINRRRASGSGG